MSSPAPWIGSGEWHLRSRTGERQGSRDRLGKALGVEQMAMYVQSQQPEFDLPGFRESMHKLMVYPRGVKSWGNASALLTSLIPPDSAYQINFRGSMYESDEQFARPRNLHLQSSQVVFANDMFAMSIFDPRSSAGPGAVHVRPPGFRDLPMQKAIAFSPEETLGLPKFIFQVLRLNPEFSHTSRGLGLPQRYTALHILYGGTLADRNALFLEETMPAREGADGPVLRNSSRPRFVTSIVEDMDFSIAQLNPSLDMSECDPTVFQYLVRELPRRFPGGSLEWIEVNPRRHTREETFHQHFYTNPSERSSNARPSRRAFSTGTRSYSTSTRAGPSLKRAFVALGSNMGNRLQNIEQACRELGKTDGIRLKRTSSLWQTKAMYMTDQDDFLNGVCEIETDLKPLDLLDTLQATENLLGRKRLVEKGPRTLDLDILLYDDEEISNERLTVPHKLMLERHFVLQPLCELIPNGKLNASSEHTFGDHLRRLGPSDPNMLSTTPLSARAEALQPFLPTRTTRAMSILNVTPDSFSDGGVHSSSDESYLQRTLKAHLDAGASIIDVGGQSTRPRAAPITAAQEIERVVPAIRTACKLIDDTQAGYKAAVSIDTYRADVARAAIEAGADIVNDVSGGTLDAEMLAFMAELGCTVILMHMRGTPETMASKEHTTYEGDLIQIIGDELLSRVKAAERAGIRRWRIILDPGIGFAKTVKQNLEILRRFGELRSLPGLQGLPWLIGASRKGFVGTITGVKEADQRTWGTAATVAASIQGGADIVRVHDVDEMVKVAKMSDAIWRV